MTWNQDGQEDGEPRISKVEMKHDQAMVIKCQNLESKALQCLQRYKDEEEEGKKTPTLATRSPLGANMAQE